MSTPTNALKANDKVCSNNCALIIQGFQKEKIENENGNSDVEVEDQ